MWKKHIKAKFTKGIDSLLDFIYPRFCTCCHERLSIHENILCAKCLLNLPRYRFRSLEENEITQLFWGLVPIQRLKSSNGMVSSKASISSSPSLLPKRKKSKEDTIKANGLPKGLPLSPISM